MNVMDGDIQIQQLAEGMDLFGQKRKADHGKILLVIPGQHNSIENIFKGNINLHNRYKGQLLSQEFRSTASGKYHIIMGLVQEASCQVQALLQIADPAVYGQYRVIRGIMPDVGLQFLIWQNGQYLHFFHIYLLIKTTSNLMFYYETFFIIIISSTENLSHYVSYVNIIFFTIYYFFISNKYNTSKKKEGEDI